MHLNDREVAVIRKNLSAREAKPKKKNILEAYHFLTFIHINTQIIYISVLVII